MRLVRSKNSFRKLPHSEAMRNKSQTIMPIIVVILLGAAYYLGFAELLHGLADGRHSGDNPLSGVGAMIALGWMCVIACACLFIVIKGFIAGGIKQLFTGL